MGWRCDWEREVERCPSFRVIGLPFGRVARQEGIFEHNSGRPLLHAFFDDAFMTACALQGRFSYPRSSRDLDGVDHYQEKAWIIFVTSKLLITGSSLFLSVFKKIHEILKIFFYVLILCISNVTAWWWAVIRSCKDVFAFSGSGFSILLG